MGGFWERLESRLQELGRDRARLARLYQIAWWLGTLFLLVGVAVIFAVELGVWDP